MYLCRNLGVGWRQNGSIVVIAFPFILDGNIFDLFAAPQVVILVSQDLILWSRLQIYKGPAQKRVHRLADHYIQSAMEPRLSR